MKQSFDEWFIHNQADVMKRIDKAEVYAEVVAAVEQAETSPQMQSKTVDEAIGYAISQLLLSYHSEYLEEEDE